MKRLSSLLAAFALLLFVAGTAHAQSQTVTITVSEVNSITTVGTASTTVDTGGELGAEADLETNGGTYDITTNGSNKKITAAISGITADTGSGATALNNTEIDALLADLVMKVNLDDAGVTTGSATSEGDVTLTRTAADVLTAISKARGTSVDITYKANVSLDVTPGTYVFTVTYTFGT